MATLNRSTFGRHWANSGDVLRASYSRSLKPSRSVSMRTEDVPRIAS
jgi:hypothetical protein